MAKRISTIIFLLVFIAPLMVQNTLNDEAQGASNRSTDTFSPNADTFISSGIPDANYGSTSYFEISYNEPDQDVILIKFDLSSLPSDAVIIDTTMWLHIQGTSLNGDAFVSVYEVTSPWNESSITWNTALSLTTSLTGITAVIDDDLNNDWKSFGLLKDYVQNWVDVPASNHGLLILPMTSYGNFWRRFSSREDSSFVPYLEVTYYRESTYYELGGRVYEGDTGIEYPASNYIEDVRVDLYCSTSSSILGTLIDTTTTDSNGWYGLKGYDGCNYYNIVEVDPPGYISNGATTVDGTVINANQIQYAGNLSTQTRTGNKFWDKPGSNTAPPDWDKSINSTPWHQSFTINVETGDTLVVEDVITPQSGNPGGFTLNEEWSQEEIDLITWDIQPTSYVPYVSNPSSEVLSLVVPPGIDFGPVTFTKWFVVQSCNWQETILHETMQAGGETINKPVIVHKEQPQLWLDSTFITIVSGGMEAEFELFYGNAGGFESSATIRSEFPSLAPFAASTPAPDDVDPHGLWAEWNLGSLAYNDTGNILILVDIASDIPIPSTINIWNRILDHDNILDNDTLITFRTPQVFLPLVIYSTSH